MQQRATGNGVGGNDGKLSLAAVTAIGIGGMIGGGIFAVLGLAIATAGHAVALTLAGGGVIALLTGLSYAHLGLAYRDDGGSFTYIEKSFASPTLAGFAGWLLVAGYVGTLALYASAFGDYGASLLTGLSNSAAVAPLLACVVLLLFLGINLTGAKLSGGVELTVVAIKLAILTLFAVVGFTTVQPDHFTPVFDRGLVTPLAAMALIFVAYEGFELIPNAVDEMRDPERNLKRALVIAILITTVLYVVVALVAQGNLSAAQIQQDQEYVLAVAARPTLGQTGFVLIGLAALLSTASAINATLFGAARLAMVMAREHALPKVFSLRERTRPVPWVSLLVLTGLAMLFTLGAPLAVISTFASATFLIIFTAVNLAALKQHRRIGLNRWVPLAGALLAAVSLVILLVHTGRNDPQGLAWLGGFYLAAAVLEVVLVARRGRRSYRD